MIRALLSLMICLMLVATSHSAGAARGSERAVGQMVICAGAQTVVVYVGADGAPVQTPHHCPDCTVHGLDGLAVGGPALGVAPVFAHHASAPPVAALRGPVRVHALARAPPYLI